MRKITILYVEDDETLSFLTRETLEQEGYDVLLFKDGNAALQGFKTSKVDLCVLDVMLPGMDGFALATSIRSFNQHIPIIFLSAKSLREDKIQGLRLGGDDYLTKPFSMEELLLKIEVFLRRSMNHYLPAEEIKYVVGSYLFDYLNLTLTHKDEEQRLTQRESDLLKYLVTNKNQLVKRSDILVAIWGNDDYFLGRSLDVFVSRLRKYLQKDERVKIENVHGVGFKFIEKETD